MTRPVPGATVRGCAMGLLASQALAAEPGPLDRTILPVQEPARPRHEEIDARNVPVPPRFEVRAPAGAPNVVIVLIDDIGFGVPATFGGPVSMPALEALATQGLRYNNFHTTAVCSPTRPALKSGRNHHTVNMAFVTELATGLPGAPGQIPNATAPLAETLRLNGYATAAFGKWHETAAWEASIAGPFDRWPTRQGFDKFYGFIGGETNQWAPAIYDGTVRVEHARRPGYHFTARPDYLLPSRVVDDIGQVFEPPECYELIEARGDLFPPADVVGILPTGQHETVFMKELDLTELAVL